jgi:hypothetical protein
VNRISSLLFFILISPYYLLSQIVPKEGSKLNYRLIGFSFSSVKHVRNYKLEIAKGNYNAEDSFKMNTIKSVTEIKNKIIAEVPSFGCQYTWRVVYYYDNASKTKSALHHFSIGIVPEVDTNITRLRILKKAETYRDAYVFLDYNKALYDMAGRPIWYLPYINGLDTQMVLRDLKITPQGTITFVIDERGAYEIDYNGDILWKTPNNGIVSGDSVEHYHHEFTRLGNGHYMALAQDFQYWKKPTPVDSNLVIITKDKIDPKEINTAYPKTPMGTLIEYDQNGNVVWSWKSSDHFNGTNLFYLKTNQGGMQMHAHENSFFFDEQAKVIYISCRNLARIIKIKYPEGNILNIYAGDNDKPGVDSMRNGIFCGQHSCRISRKGYLYLFNNNICNKGAPPSIIMLQEPNSEKGGLKKIWEYKCDIDGNFPFGFPSGGNVIELPDYSMFISMAFPDSKVLIVNMDKEILWKAKAEKWDPIQKTWESINLYRASIIAKHEDLEQLIWNQKIK